MSLQNIGTYIHERLPLFVGIGLIISVHWGWYQLQQNPALVPEKDRKDLPPVRVAKSIHKILMDKWESVSTEKQSEEVVVLGKSK